MLPTLAAYLWPGAANNFPPPGGGMPAVATNLAGTAMIPLVEAISDPRGSDQ